MTTRLLTGRRRHGPARGTTTRNRRLSATAVTASLAVATALSGAATPTGASAAGTGRPRTELTVAISDCEGCTVQLHQTLPGPRGRRFWSSKTATVAGGRAVLDVPTRRTFASTMTLQAPWEGQLGYLTTVVMRYPGKAPGDHVSSTEAADARRANACWEGTRGREASLEVAVEPVTVRGVHGKVTGTRAWLPTTTVWTGDLRPAPKGVLGTQDFDVCGA